MPETATIYLLSLPDCVWSEPVDSSPLGGGGNVERLVDKLRSVLLSLPKTEITKQSGFLRIRVVSLDIQNYGKFIKAVGECVRELATTNQTRVAPRRKSKHFSFDVRWILRQPDVLHDSPTSCLDKDETQHGNNLDTVQGDQDGRQTATGCPTLEEAIDPDFFKLLCDPTRVRILIVLIRADDALPVGEIAERSKASPQNTSIHLGKLKSGGLVAAARDGNNILYSITHLFADTIRDLNAALTK